MKSASSQRPPDEQRRPALDIKATCRAAAGIRRWFQVGTAYCGCIDECRLRRCPAENQSAVHGRADFVRVHG
jgi:hypothetical protein